MCIIILKSEGKKLTDEAMENSRDMNGHGYGYSFIHNEKIITKKFMKYKKFYKQYRNDEETYLDTTPFLVHFRACSKGAINVQNAHPFIINDSQVFAHNGTIYGLPEDEKKSDTNLFNRTIMRKLPYEWEKNEGIINLIRGMIGATNRIVVLNKDKSYIIFNEGKGEWIDGIWYSNEHYLGTFYRNANGQAVKFVTAVDSNMNYDRWNREYDEYWNGVHGDINGQGVLPYSKPEYNTVPTQPIVSDRLKSDTPSCDFCGMSAYNGKVVRNTEFDDMYDFCESCAKTLVPMGGLEYVV